MNRIILLLALLLAVGDSLTAQEWGHHAPSTVQRSFHRDFPEARNPRWRSAHNQWHADFEDHSRYDRGEMVAHYDRRGRHVDSHIPYDRNDVPPVVIDRTERNYPGGRDYQYTRIEHPGGQAFFQVSLNLQGRNKVAYVDDNGHERQYHDRH